MLCYTPFCSTSVSYFSFCLLFEFGLPTNPTFAPIAQSSHIRFNLPVTIVHPHSPAGTHGFLWLGSSLGIVELLVAWLVGCSSSGAVCCCLGRYLNENFVFISPLCFYIFLWSYYICFRQQQCGWKLLKGKYMEI